MKLLDHAKINGQVISESLSSTYRKIDCELELIRLLTDTTTISLLLYMLVGGTKTARAETANVG